MKKLVIGLAALSAAVAAYWVFLRRTVLNWGATEAEIARTLPGDELVPHPAIETTRAITIEAPPEAIWPWLVQMGTKPRAGAYTYAWIERMLGIDIENSDRILPEFQHLEPGEFLGVSGEGQGLRVAKVDEGRALVVEWVPQGSSWTFALCPEDDRSTRLLSRNRIPGGGLGFWLAMAGFMEPGSLVMERKMLRGIKQRAERLVIAPAAV